MNLDHYAYLMSEDFLTYHSCSEGPNGKIRKVILFTLVTMPSVKKIESSKKIVEKYGFPKELIAG